MMNDEKDQAEMPAFDSSTDHQDQGTNAPTDSAPMPRLPLSSFIIHHSSFDRRGVS